MWKKHAFNSMYICLLAGFLTFSLANFKVLKSIPLYPLDYISLAIIFFGSSFIIQVYKGGSLSQRKKIQERVAVLLLFILSAFLSWYINGQGMTSLGQLKSWLVLPLLSSAIAMIALMQDSSRDKKILLFWFAGTLVLAASIIPYLLHGTFTFDGRLEGPFTSPNFLAFFLFPGVLLSFYYFESTKDFFQKGVFVLLTATLLGFLFLTHSFGGWLALIAASSWYLLRTYSLLNKKGIFILGSIAVVLMLFIGGELVTSDKLSGALQERSSLASRFMIWQVAVHAIKDNPVLGIGVGNFQEVYLAYQPQFIPYLEWAVPEPHNLFLALWLQTGLLGLLAMFLLLAKVFSPKENFTREQILIQALLVGMLFYGIFDTPLFGNALAFVWWLALAALLFPIIKKEL